VQVDGVIVRTPETRIDPEKVKVAVRGNTVTPPIQYRYILLNKPPGVICTCKPGREKGPNILDVVKVPERIFPVGRLDKNTTGLILLTNDGALSQRLTHPSFQKEKEYIVETTRPITANHLGRLKKGVQLEDGKSRFLHIEKTGEKGLRLVLTEGRKRQIRRTLKAISLPIRSLHRLRVGKLNLSGLPEGKWRDLKPGELRLLIDELE
jgi:23S rRNA pseudouridine2605 synthase/23S rRNA pseudouridine2604 synthase